MARINWAFPHPAIQEQTYAPQPDLAWLLAGYILMAKGLTWLCIALMHWSVFVRFAKTHFVEYTATFYTVQMGIALWFALHFITRFRPALWTSAKRGLIYLIGSICLLLPLLAWHLHTVGLVHNIFEIIITIPTFSGRRQALTAVYYTIWNPLTADTSLVSIIFVSISSFVLPVYEEMIFSGFVANRLAARFGTMAAVSVTPFCFAIAHIPRFGFDVQLVLLGCAGTAYVLIRFWTGSILYPILAHLLVNFAVFLSKWWVAYAYFLMNSKR